VGLPGRRGGEGNGVKDKRKLEGRGWKAMEKAGGKGQGRGNGEKGTTEKDRGGKGKREGKEARFLPRLK